MDSIEMRQLLDYCARQYPDDRVLDANLKELARESENMFKSKMNVQSNSQANDISIEDLTVTNSQVAESSARSSVNLSEIRKETDKLHAEFLSEIAIKSFNSDKDKEVEEPNLHHPQVQPEYVCEPLAANIEHENASQETADSEEEASLRVYELEEEVAEKEKYSNAQKLKIKELEKNIYEKNQIINSNNDEGKEAMCIITSSLDNLNINKEYILKLQNDYHNENALKTILEFNGLIEELKQFIYETRSSIENIINLESLEIKKQLNEQFSVIQASIENVQEQYRADDSSYILEELCCEIRKNDKLLKDSLVPEGNELNTSNYLSASESTNHSKLNNEYLNNNSSTEFSDQYNFLEECCDNEQEDEKPLGAEMHKEENEPYDNEEEDNTSVILLKCIESLSINEELLKENPTSSNNVSVALTVSETLEEEENLSLPNQTKSIVISDKVDSLQHAVSQEFLHLSLLANENITKSYEYEKLNDFLVNSCESLSNENVDLHEEVSQQFLITALEQNIYETKIEGFKHELLKCLNEDTNELIDELRQILIEHRGIEQEEDDIAELRGKVTASEEYEEEFWELYSNRVHDTEHEFCQTDDQLSVEPEEIQIDESTEYDLITYDEKETNTILQTEDFTEQFIFESYDEKYQQTSLVTADSEAETPFVLYEEEDLDNGRAFCSNQLEEDFVEAIMLDSTRPFISTLITRFILLQGEIKEYEQEITTNERREQYLINYLQGKAELNSKINHFNFGDVAMQIIDVQSSKLEEISQEYLHLTRLYKQEREETKKEADMQETYIQSLQEDVVLSNSELASKKRSNLLSVISIIIEVAFLAIEVYYVMVYSIETFFG